MGGGNAQKSATSRMRNLAKAEAEKSGGGGKAGMEGKLLKRAFMEHR
jgi:hypothetical protein